MKKRHPLSERFHQLLAKCGELHDRKQADYGRDDDPFANVRSSGDFGVPGWVGAMVRGNDKMKRIQKAAKQVVDGDDIELENESMENSLFDLAVYSLIAYVLYEEENGLLPADLFEEEDDQPLAEAWAPTTSPYIEFVSWPPPVPRRYSKATSTRNRKPLVSYGVPTDFPLRWMDQADDIYRVINKETRNNYHPPEHIFIPERVKGAKMPPGMAFWGVPVEVDPTLDDDEFVVRIYRSGARLVEFHHYRFSQGAVT